MAIRFNATEGDNLIQADIFSGSTLTLMCWARLVSDTDALQTFFQCEEGGDFVIQTISDGVTLAYVDGSTEHTGTALNVGQWYHIACVKVNATDVIIYLDGVSDISVTGASITADSIKVGGSAFTGEELDGRIAAMKAWSDALSLEQILNEMRYVIAIKRSNLLGEWHLFPDTLVTDFSGNGNNFTENGANTDEDHPPVMYSPVVPYITVAPAAAGITKIVSVVPSSFSVVASTRSMGTVTKALAAIGSAYSIVGATRSMGTKTITPTIPVAAFSVVALSLLRTIKASIVSAAYSVVASTRSMGTKTITPTIPSAAFSVIPATGIAAILRIVAVVSAAFSVVAPSRVMGTATRTISAVSAAYSVVSATAVNAILRTVAAISAVFSVVATTRAMGTATRAVSAVSAVFSVVSPSRIMGTATRAVGAVGAVFSAVSPTRIMGTATRAVAAVSSAFSVVSPTRIMGAMSKTVSVVAAAFSVKAVTTQLGAIVSFFLTSIITFSARVSGAFSSKARVSGTQETKAKVSGKAEINKP